ncbi:hypothetical protein HYPSUDRAFT_35438 [Hypholoma sublateritium FD-334 SS-4]|uniref:Uncharacterized protein n=1 Tax=Hypholoma sublateritium (strain FD-334 SS-4) TaxID=945553 RepID=A0A0D2P9C3_HYPSF|nr:hypothetical protein HYPSUDRAFT_35438 [Hypholoma sublateritium FD-334 SS-4]
MGRSNQVLLTMVLSYLNARKPPTCPLPVIALRHPIAQISLLPAARHFMRYKTGLRVLHPIHQILLAFSSSYSNTRRAHAHPLPVI